MRIAYLCQSYPPMVSGAALIVQRLAEGLAARGHEMLVLAASDRGHPYTEQLDYLTVARLRGYPNPLRAGQRFLLWPGRAIDSELRQFRPQLLHMHDFSQASIAGLRAGRRMNLPIVLTLHALPWIVSPYVPPVPGLRRVVESMLWAYLHRLTEYCEAVVTSSPAIGDVVSQHIARRPTPISFGVDLNRFSPHPAAHDEGSVLRRRYGLDPELPIILFVGRIDADKRVEQVVRAAAQAMRTVKAQLLIVGDGTLRASVRCLCETLGIRSVSHFPGFVPHTGDLPGLYRLASVFVLASEIETFGLVALEAMAAGVPVVAVRAGSMAELVEDRVNGFLAAPGDVNGLAERLRIVLQEPDQAGALREAGLAVARQYSITSTLTGHEQFYHSVLKGRRMPDSENDSGRG